jgi:hypothetical protein
MTFNCNSVMSRRHRSFYQRHQFRKQMHRERLARRILSWPEGGYQNLAFSHASGETMRRTANIRRNIRRLSKLHGGVCSLPLIQPRFDLLPMASVAQACCCVLHLIYKGLDKSIK